MEKRNDENIFNGFTLCKVFDMKNAKPINVAVSFCDMNICTVEESFNGESATEEG